MVWGNLFCTYIGILEDDEKEEEGVNRKQNVQNKISNIGTFIKNFFIVCSKKYDLATQQKTRVDEMTETESYKKKFT